MWISDGTPSKISIFPRSSAATPKGRDPMRTSTFQGKASRNDPKLWCFARNSDTGGWTVWSARRRKASLSWLLWPSERSGCVSGSKQEIIQPKPPAKSFGNYLHSSGICGMRYSKPSRPTTVRGSLTCSSWRMTERTDWRSTPLIHTLRAKRGQMSVTTECRVYSFPRANRSLITLLTIFASLPIALTTCRGNCLTMQHRRRFLRRNLSAFTPSEGARHIGPCSGFTLPLSSLCALPRFGTILKIIATCYCNLLKKRTQK